MCSTRNVDLVRSLGADHVIDYTTNDFATNGERYDAILATNGDRSIWDYKRALTADGSYAMTGGSNRHLAEALLFGPLFSLGRQRFGNVLMTPNQLRDYPAAKTIIICTGSQGEPTSALTRMATGTHQQIAIQEGDTVILSSNPVPGNEKFVYKNIDLIMQSGAKVIYNRISDVHVRGHAAREELKIIHRLVRPRYFLPIHGEYRHLVHHSRLAQAVGVAADNTYVVTDGHGNTDTGSVNLFIATTIGIPNAVDDTATVPMNTGTSIAVLANDTDPRWADAHRDRQGRRNRGEPAGRRDPRQGTAGQADA